MGCKYELCVLRCSHNSIYELFLPLHMKRQFRLIDNKYVSLFDFWVEIKMGENNYKLNLA